MIVNFVREWPTRRRRHAIHRAEHELPLITTRASRAARHRPDGRDKIQARSRPERDAIGVNNILANALGQPTEHRGTATRTHLLHGRGKAAILSSVERSAGTSCRDAFPRTAVTGQPIDSVQQATAAAQRDGDPRPHLNKIAGAPSRYPVSAAVPRNVQRQRPAPLPLRPTPPSCHDDLLTYVKARSDFEFDLGQPSDRAASTPIFVVTDALRALSPPRQTP